MKKGICFAFVFLVLIMLSTVSSDIFSWFKESVTGKASSQPTNVSIQVIVPLPNLTISSPTSITYSTTSILLNYTTQYAVSVWYSLDGGGNISISSPVFITASEGSHTLYLYANNTDGNKSSTNVSFSVDLSAPSGDGGGGGGVVKKEGEKIEGEEQAEEIEEEIEEELETPFKELESFLLEFEYDRGEISLADKSLEEGFYPTLSHDVEREYRINAYAENGSLLYSTSFNNPEELFSDIFEDNETGGGIMKLNKMKFYLLIPPTKNLDKIEILKRGEKILEEEINLESLKVEEKNKVGTVGMVIKRIFGF